MKDNKHKADSISGFAKSIKMEESVKKNISLKEYSSFKIGGLAQYFVSIKNSPLLIEAVKWAVEKKIPFFIIGGGSNTLFFDETYKGLVIRTNSRKVKVENCLMKADTGVLLAELIKLSVDYELSGLEWAAGIPGTIGGAVCGNAGAFGINIKDIVNKITVLDLENFQKRVFSNDQCKFSYRSSIFKKEKKFIILEVEIKLASEKKNKEEIIEKIESNLLYRREHHPFEFPSIGSIFKNPAISDIFGNKQNDFKSKDKKFVNIRGNSMPVCEGKIPAAYLIDQCDLKGKKIGGAQISEKHPNFIINTNGARAEDVMILISLIKQKVRNKFGIFLEEEVVFGR